MEQNCSLPCPSCDLRSRLILYFLDWYSVKFIIVHALLMGVIVEGIKFFGLHKFTYF